MTLTYSDNAAAVSALVSVLTGGNLNDLRRLLIGGPIGVR